MHEIALIQNQAPLFTYETPKIVIG